MSRSPRQQRQRPPEAVRAATLQPTAQRSAGAGAGDAASSSLPDEMQLRLGSMHDAWVHAEGLRLRSLLDAADSAPDSAHQFAILQQLVALDPELLEGQAEIAALVRRAEALIDRCRAADQRPACHGKPTARDQRTDRA